MLNYVNTASVIFRIVRNHFAIGLVVANFSSTLIFLKWLNITKMFALEKSVNKHSFNGNIFYNLEYDYV